MRIQIRRLAILFALTLTSLPAAASVWDTTRQWDVNVDAEFGRWIARVPMTIFNDPKSAHYGIATDCAKAAYALRIIFSAQNGLPVRFLNENDLDNTSAAFDSLPPAARMRAFIKHVFTKTGTVTLTRDTYPVAIDPATLRPGTMFLHNPTRGPGIAEQYTEGHVYYVQRVPPNGIITYFSSTVPVSVKAMTTRVGINFAPWNTSSGYRNWKWPGASEQNGYSTEQFSLARWHAQDHSDEDGLWERWQAAVQEQIRSRPPTSGEKSSAAEINLRMALQERQTTIREGWAYYQRHYPAGRCMSRADYNDWSTSNRDRKVSDAVEEFRAAAGDSANQFTFAVSRRETLSFAQLYDLFETAKILPVSEPEHSPEVRWGLEEITDWVCPERAKQYRGHELLGQ